jgi:hypothetical protein
LSGEPGAVLIYIFDLTGKKERAGLTALSKSTELSLETAFNDNLPESQIGNLQ